MDGTLVTTGQLAKLLDLTTARVRQLVDEGVITKSGRSKFDLLACNVAYINFLRSKAENNASNGSDHREQKTRLTKAQADAAEIELARKRGELAPIVEFEKATEAIMHVIRSNIMNVPNRVTTQLLGETNEARFKSVMRAELVQAMTDSANTEIEWDDDE